MASTSESVSIGVIGGSGLYNMADISDKMTISVDTPFGKPSADIVIGTLYGKRVAFLPRHGVGHIYNPTEVPYRANIYALKSLGVRFILSANACGSLREQIAPGHLVVPDQIYDQTKSERGGRSFFEGGLVAHTSVADPFCPDLCKLMVEATQDAAHGHDDAAVHSGGTFVIIEGPRFSTRAESQVYRSWGCSIIGMTTCPEAFLAREAEISYATIAHVTDYDVWHQTEEPVTAAMVIKTFERNIVHVQRAIANTVERIDITADYGSHHALKDAITSARSAISAETRQRLSLLIGQYL